MVREFFKGLEEIADVDIKYLNFGNMEMPKGRKKEKQLGLGNFLKKNNIIQLFSHLPSK